MDLSAGHHWMPTTQELGTENGQNPLCPICGAKPVHPGTVPAPTALFEPATLAPHEVRDEGSAPVSVPGYEILEEIGRGGMGVVYRARQRELNRLVALKMILAGSYAGDAEQARFRLEAETLALLNHPNIVRIYEVGSHEGQPFLALEFVEGGSLAQQLEGTEPETAVSAALVETLARPMHAAHQRGIVHRDLKPENVLLEKDGTPKITDFGLAKRLDGSAGLTASNAVMGTPSYMAPEQAEGRSGLVGPSADVYALGAILYRLLTGQPPFEGSTPLETIRQVVADDPRPPMQIQPRIALDLETICLKCLRKLPTERYSSALELADDLRRFLDGKPIQARPLGMLEKGIKWVRRRPALAAVYGLCVVVLLMGSSGVGIFRLWRADESASRRTVQDFQEASQARDQLTIEKQQIEQITIEAQRIEHVLKADHGSAVSSYLAFEKDGQVLTLISPKSHSIRVWDLMTSREDDAIQLQKNQGSSYMTRSGDGRRLALESDDRTVAIFDSHTGKEIQRLPKAAGSVKQMSLSGDGKFLAITCTDCNVIVWDTTRAKQVWAKQMPANGFGSLCINGDGSLLALLESSAKAEPEITICRTAGGPKVCRLKGHEGEISHIAFSSDGKRLASVDTAGTDGLGTVDQWDLTTGRCTLRISLGDP